MKPNHLATIIASAAALAFASPSVFAGDPSMSPSPSPSRSPGSFPSTSFDQRMQHLENQLDSVFADTFRGFGNWFGNSSFGNSIDLRDQKNAYVARIYVPGGDTSKVNAKVRDGALHVTAENQSSKNGNSETERYAQTISLPGPVDSSRMQIERKQNLVVIHLPKAKNLTASSSPAASPSADASQENSAAPDQFAFDQSVVSQMNRMQQRMNQIFRDAFPNDLTNAFNNLSLNSAVHVDDENGRYVVRFYLPDQDLNNMEVKLNGRELQLRSSRQQTSRGNRGTSSLQLANEESIMLPGPVKKGGMHVERRDGTIVVTVPKA